MDLFDDMPSLDISVLTNKDGKQTTVETPTVNQGTGRFGFSEPEPITVDETEEQKTASETKEAEDKAKGVAQTTDTTETTTTDTVESPTKLISSFLKEKGVIDYTDEEFKDEDDFISEQVSKQITSGVQTYKDTLPDEIKQLIENYETGVPLGKLLEHEQKAFELNSITADKIKEDSRLQEELVEALMLNTGWSQAEADERIKELQDAGIMEKEALRAHPKLIQLDKMAKDEELKQVQETRKKETARYQEQVNQLQTTIKDTKEFFEGVTTNDAEKKAVFEAITKYDKTGKNKIGQLLNDPKNYIKVAYFLEVLKGDITKLKKAATTAAVNTTRKAIDPTTVKTESRFAGKDLAVLDKFLKSKQSFL